MGKYVQTMDKKLYSHISNLKLQELVKMNKNYIKNG